MEDKLKEIISHNVQKVYTKAMNNVKTTFLAKNNKQLT